MFFLLLVLAIIVFFIVRGIVTSKQRKKLAEEFSNLDAENKYLDQKRNGYLLIDDSGLSFRMRNKPLITVPQKDEFVYLYNDVAYPVNHEQYKLKLQPSDFSLVKSLFESSNYLLVDNVFKYSNKHGKGSLVRNFDSTISVVGDPDKRNFILTEISYSPVYVTETKGKTSGRVGSTLVGGALLGPVGALAGSARSRKTSSTSTTTEKRSLGQIVLTDINTKERLVIDLYLDRTIYSTLNKNYVASQKQIDQYLSSPVEHSYGSDADELLKFKKLLDAGAIDQEEYDTKKKQLLGI
jgi:hypothetical protein